MRSNFIKAVLADKRKERQIMPLAKIDGKILSEVIEAISNINQPLLKQLLLKYKTIPDIELYDQLAKFNVDYSYPEFGDDADELNGRKFITISGKKDINIDIRGIFSFETENSFNAEKGNYSYRIIINREDGMAPPGSNKRIEYYSEEQRDIEYAKLQKKLEKYKITFI